MNDEQFRQLLDYFQYSWAGYRKVRKGVKKRISRHMQELQCSNIAPYLNLIEVDDKLRLECERRMTVSISRFFRDRKLWLDLESEILPRLIESEKENLKVWSAGCARGEEIYSFKLVWERLKTRFLTYYRYDLIKESLTKILESLNPGGWLIIGSHEKLPDGSKGLTRSSSTPWAYYKDFV
jgi:chemotaxis methyl-accepting protein methylase